MYKQVCLLFTFIMFCYLEETKADFSRESQSSFVRDIANVPCSKQFPRDYDPNWSGTAASVPYSKEDQVMLGKENEAMLDSINNCLCGVQCSCPLSCACRNTKSVRSQSMGHPCSNRLAVRNGPVSIQSKAQEYSESSREVNNPPPPAHHCCNPTIDNTPDKTSHNEQVESDSTFEKNNRNAALNEYTLSPIGITNQKNAEFANDNSAQLDSQNTLGSQDENTNVNLNSPTSQGLTNENTAQFNGGLTNENSAYLYNPNIVDLTNENTASLADNTSNLNEGNEEGSSNSIETPQSTNENNVGSIDESNTNLITLAGDNEAGLLQSNSNENELDDIARVTADADALAASNDDVAMRDTIEALSVKKDASDNNDMNQVRTANDNQSQDNIIDLEDKTNENKAVKLGSESSEIDAPPNSLYSENMHILDTSNLRNTDSSKLSENRNVQSVKRPSLKNSIREGENSDGTEVQPNANADSFKTENMDSGVNTLADNLQSSTKEEFPEASQVKSKLSDESLSNPAAKLLVSQRAINPKQLEFSKSKSDGFADDYNEEIRSKRDLLDTMESIEPREEIRQDCYN